MVFFQFHIVIAEIKQDFKVGETAVGINVVVIGADFPAESFDDDSLNVFEMLLVVVEPIGDGISDHDRIRMLRDENSQRWKKILDFKKN